jgi:hypothetical protein
MPAQNDPPAPVSESLADRGIDRVACFGPVDGDDQDPVALFDQDFGFGCFFAHAAIVKGSVSATVSSPPKPFDDVD